MAQEQDQSATHAIAEAVASGTGSGSAGTSGSGPETTSGPARLQEAALAPAQPQQVPEEEDDDDPTSVLAGFKLERVLDQDAKTRSAVLLGTFASQLDGGGGGEERAIVLLEKTHFEPNFYAQLGEVIETPQAAAGLTGMGSEKGVRLQHLSKLVRLGQNDVYNWLMAWRSEGYTTTTSGVPADMKINVIRPATAAHISKYERQEKILVRETPEMYARIVRPWIEGQPATRINWVYNILEGKNEKENVLFSDEDPLTGFVVSVGALRRKLRAERCILHSHLTATLSLSIFLCISPFGRADPSRPKMGPLYPLLPLPNQHSARSLSPLSSLPASRPHPAPAQDPGSSSAGGP